VTFEGHFSDLVRPTVFAQLTRDLLAIGKFLVVVAGRLERSESDSLDSLRLSDGHDSDVAPVSQTTTPRRQRQLQQQQQMRAEEDAWLIPESVVIDADGTTFQQQVRQLLTRHEKVLMRRALSQFRETGYDISVVLSPSITSIIPVFVVMPARVRVVCVCACSLYTTKRLGQSRPNLKYGFTLAQC